VKTATVVNSPDNVSRNKLRHCWQHAVQIAVLPRSAVRMNSGAGSEFLQRREEPAGVTLTTLPEVRGVEVAVAGL